MSDRTGPRTPVLSPDELVEVIEEQAARLAALDRRIAALEAELSTEIRTRRVVVVDDVGRDRVVLYADDSTGEDIAGIRTMAPGGWTNAELVTMRSTSSYATSLFMSLSGNPAFHVWADENAGRHAPHLSITGGTDTTLAETDWEPLGHPAPGARRGDLHSV